MKSRRVLAAIAVVLFVAAGLYWKLRPTAFVSRIRAASADEAVFLMRQNTDRTTRFWISSQSTDGPRWVHRLPRDTQDVVWRSLTVTDTLVTYHRQRADRISEVVALDRASGEPVWRTVVGVADPLGPSPFLYGDSRVHGGLLIEPTHAEELVALSLEDGTIRWRTPVSSMLRVLRQSEEALWFVDQDLHFSSLRLDDGVLTVGPPSSSRCLERDRILTLRDGVLQEVGGAVVAALPGVEGGLRSCGRYDGGLVVTVLDEGQTHLVRIQDGAVSGHLTLDWDLRLGMSLSNAAVNLNIEQHYVLAGEMTRYLPLILSRGIEDELFDLIVIDLDAMTIHRQATPQRDYLQLEVLRVGTMHYLWYHGGLLIALDGETGALTGAARGGRDFSGRHVADGVVWLGGEGRAGWQPPRRPAGAWLDGRTLTLLGTTGRTDAFSSAEEDVAELTGWTFSTAAPRLDGAAR